VIGCGRIPRGEEHPIKSNTGRRRLNINGAIDVRTMSAHVRFDDTIDAASAIALMAQIDDAYPDAATITVICDNARYYRSKAVREYLETLRIELFFLPPYSPNLNLIERFWKFFKKQDLYNRYYEAFEDFRGTCKNCFRNVDIYASPLWRLLVENCEIIRY
jgi:transposase